MADEPELRRETLVVSAGRPESLPGAALSPPVAFASTYHADGELVYGRYHNPTWAAFEEALGQLEGGSALAFSSGMAAAAAVLEEVPVGGRVVAPASAYHGVRELLADQRTSGRLEFELVDGADTSASISALPGAQLLWIETPSNPLIGIADIAALAKAARDAGVMTVVDSTFATPLLQRPLELGADAVMHSATKYLGGHADLVMGVIAARDAELLRRLRHRRDIGGAVPGAMEAFLALRGLRTLAVRLERAEANARVLSERLAAHPAIERVHYPGLTGDPGHDLAAQQMRGFGAMLSFVVRGDADAAERICAAVRVITHATSLGGVESLMERRARWPGDAGVPPGLIRLSVGIEHVDDLWIDLERALGVEAD